MSSCAEGAAFRKYLTVMNPVFRAQVHDADVAPLPSLNVRFEVKAEPVGGGTVLTGVSGTGAPGGDVAGDPERRHGPGQDLSLAGAAHLDLNSDGSVMQYGQWTAPCEVGYDATAIVHPPTVEGIPTVLQDDDGDGTPETAYRVLDYGKPAELTFRANPVDVGKIVGFRYGFSQEVVAAPNAPMVPAAADGSATAVVTNWRSMAQESRPDRSSCTCVSGQHHRRELLPLQGRGDLPAADRGSAGQPRSG